MGKNRYFVIGMLAIIQVFGLVFTGCSRADAADNSFVPLRFEWENPWGPYEGMRYWYQLTPTTWIEEYIDRPMHVFAFEREMTINDVSGTLVSRFSGENFGDYTFLYAFIPDKNEEDNRLFFVDQDGHGESFVDITWID